MLIGIVVSKIFGDMYVQKSIVYSYNLHSIYVFTVLPIYALIYGALSYIVYKKIGPQQILLAIAAIFGFSIIEIIEESGLIIAILILTPCYVLISLIGSQISALFCMIVKQIKESHNKNSKTEEQNIETE